MWMIGMMLRDEAECVGSWMMCMTLRGRGEE